MVGGALALLVAGCAGIPAAKPPVATATPGRAVVRMPAMMQVSGLENVIGASASSLTRRFGEPRLDVAEGDVRKLQFAGRDCVMDIYLYPMQRGEEPVATHVEARQRQGGAPVDRRQCLGEITRR